MKQIIITLIAVTVINMSLTAQPEKNISAKIKHVTVFYDRAQIDRETSVAISPGNITFKLTGLSPYIDNRSIRVKGQGDFTILSVNHQNNYLQNLEDSPEVKDIRNQIENLQIKVEDEKAAIGVLKEKEAFLVANRAILVKETTFSLEQLKNVMDLYTTNMDQVTMTNLKKNRLIKEYEKQISALQKQLSDKLGKQKLPSGEISVIVTSKKQSQGKLEISYVVTNAGWYPSYDIRVDNISDPVSILYKANVYQSSGVEWKDVKLSLSNATPWVSGNIPVLYPWFINYYTPVPAISKGKISTTRSQAPAMMMEMAEYSNAEMKIKETVPIPVNKRIGETTITFDIAIPYTIPSDGKQQTVEIQELTAPSDYKYVAMPKLSKQTYLTANIADWAKLSLQNGEATLYFENSYVGKSQLNVNQLKDTLEVSLGADNSILVKREKRKDFTSKKIVGANKTDTYSFLLTIRNNKPSSIRITLSDQIPVSSNSDITVDPVQLSGGKLNSKTGIIEWDMELQKQETKEIVLTYSVKYPKDKTIILE